MPLHASRLLFVLFMFFVLPSSAYAALKAGAFAQDITPTEFPVIVNGGFLEGKATKANDKLHARALVLEDGGQKIAIVIVDSCMLPRELLDPAKDKAALATGIAADHILIAATHTHSAPSSMGALGSSPDDNYVKFLPDLLVRSIVEANKRLAPAKIGWTVVNDPKHTACRRYIFRPDRMRKDPFGDLTVRANMHPGYQSPDALGPSGPEDPGFSIVSLQHPDGRPLALLANYSMHYVGAPALSADYYGLFCDKIAKLIGGDEQFVALSSQGTSGDMWLADYSGPKPEKRMDIETFAQAMAQQAADAIKTIQYRSDAPIVMREAKLSLKRRIPDEKRLGWARDLTTKMAGAKPKNQPEVYAREAIYLHEDPVRELKLQAIRIGDLGITAMPNEVYALTGLKVKARSPLAVTFNMSLANGSEGYIPPPEQHKLGGYTTWPARTAALEEQAETRICETVVSLLENVSGKPRREAKLPSGGYASALLAAKPGAYWRMDEMDGRQCFDATGNGAHGLYEDGAVFYLPGAKSPALTGDPAHPSRAAQFAGGRMTVQLQEFKGPYSVEFFAYNALSPEARPVTAYLFSRGPNGDRECPGDHLGIGGTAENAAGKLIFYNGNGRKQLLVGKSVLSPKTWYHIAMTRDGNHVKAWVNGVLEIDGQADVTSDAHTLYFAGRCDNFANLEGKLDEVALHRRALTDDEVKKRFELSSLETAAVVPAPQAIAKRPYEPREPLESMKTIHVPPDMNLDLVVSEPLISSPVALDWGPDGKLWVVEMLDYPYGMDGKGKPGGRVKYLEDTDNDGKYDKATIYADELTMPNGILVWRDGVIVTSAPDVLFIQKDKRTVLLSGFKVGNPQLRVNALRWGVDNWVYLATGLSAGVVTSPRTGQTLDTRNRDLRWKPDTGEIELVSGPSQYGRACDDWGRWFGVHNAQPLFHFALEDRYLKRNTSITFPDVRNQLLPLPMPPVFPKSPFAKRYIGLDHHGHYTSACGITVYRDNLLFAGEGYYASHAFICEPVHNLIQHQALSEKGASFSAQRLDGEKGADFFAAEDPWCRPVMTRTGPDGALWVIDMYRYMIEHPDWLNEEGKKAYAPFYRDGAERGRIYRLYPKSAKPRNVAKLSGATTEQLVAALESPNGFLRDQAQMLLLWKNDPAAVAALEKLTTHSKSPQARLHALYALESLSALQPNHIARALSDPQPGVRVHALRLAETCKDTSVRDAARRLVIDDHAGVRLQLAYTLGEWPDEPSGLALAQIMQTSADDPNLSAAILSSATPHLTQLVRHARPGMGTFAGLLTMATAANDRPALAVLVGALLTDPAGAAARFDALGKWLDSLAARRSSVDLLAKGSDDLSKQMVELRKLFADAAKLAADDRAPTPDRAAALGLLGRDRSRTKDDLALLSALFSPQVPAEVQLAAVKAAARTADPSVAALFLDKWPAMSPAVRAAVSDVLLSREPWALQLANSSAARQLAFTHRQRLLNSGFPRVKEAARKTINEADASTSRQKIIDDNKEALTLKGDPEHGQQLYTENCATCHRVGSSTVGHDIGPNILTVRDWSRDNLLTAILDPDRTADPRYLSYVATLADGTQLTGLLTTESAGGVTIKTIDNQDHSVPRASIKSLASTGHSLMPTGFEATMSPQDLADLMAYIQKN